LLAGEILEFIQEFYVVLIYTLAAHDAIRKCKP